MALGFPELAFTLLASLVIVAIVVYVPVAIRRAGQRQRHLEARVAALEAELARLRA